MKLWYHRGRGPAQCPLNADPDSNTDWGVEWGNFFGDGVAITSVEWDTGTLTKGQDGIVMEYTQNGITYKNVAMVQLSGFVAGTLHSVRCRAFTADGNSADRTMLILGQEQ